MTDKQNLITEVKEALEKITKGEWRAEDGEWDNPAILLTYEGEQVKQQIAEFGFKNENADAHLIANAPTWLQQLVTELEEAHKENERLLNAINESMQIEWSLAGESTPVYTILHNAFHHNKEECYTCSGCGYVSWDDQWGEPQGGECPTCKGLGAIRKEGL